MTTDGNKNQESFQEGTKTTDKRVYTVEEIQNILGTSRPTIYNLIKRQEFKSVRIGRHIRVSKQSFDEWLDKQM